MSNKPIVVARHDFMTDLAELINKSGLPAFVVVEVLERTLPEVRKIAEKELREGIKRYMTEKGGNADGKEANP